jgi:DNA-binding transcriptional ArsR family regulator
MPEHSDAMFEELRTVRDRVEEVLGVLNYIASDPEIEARNNEALRKFFGRGGRRADVYLALDSTKNITQVAESLGMKRQNVSAELRALRDANLILQHTAGGGGDVWIRNPTLERVLRLSHKIRSWYQSNPAAARAKK